MRIQQRAVIVLFALILISGLTSFTSYSCTSQLVARDMDRALLLTMKEQQCDVITQDTIGLFNSHLQMEALRGKATLAVDTRQKDFACYAHCSVATIFSLSDQRPATVLWSISLLWGMFCLYLRMRKGTSLMKQGVESYGGLTYSETEGKFLNSDGEPIRLTPMQQELMRMFFCSPSHRLRKAEICDTLWPRKPDANDTLYTLIKRLRPIIEEHTSLKIESDRGYSYQLKDKDLE
ncbi:MAG: helix-turn-helix domain-containing protein [Bacteroidaceae bacterium]|nr:helix-turn-helix domain-containing protein [Bacteroidaceae bacterium]